MFNQSNNKGKYCIQRLASKQETKASASKPTEKTGNICRITFNLFAQLKLFPGTLN